MVQLVQLKVADALGHCSRDVVVPASISMFNLHRVIQYCIKPRQVDSAIGAKAFSFYHVRSGKLVRAPKSTTLNRASPATTTSLLVGDGYDYEADKAKYLVQIVATGSGDDRYYVPRCIDGNTDVDGINAKLLTRRFTMAGAGKPKKLPAVWCSRSTPKAAIMASRLAAMREPL